MAIMRKAITDRNYMIRDRDKTIKELRAFADNLKPMDEKCMRLEDRIKDLEKNLQHWKDLEGGCRLKIGDLEAELKEKTELLEKYMLMYIDNPKEIQKDAPVTASEKVYNAVRCKKCGLVLMSKTNPDNFKVCEKCGAHWSYEAYKPKEADKKPDIGADEKAKRRKKR